MARERGDLRWATLVRPRGVGGDWCRQQEQQGLRPPCVRLGRELWSRVNEEGRREGGREAREPSGAYRGPCRDSGFGQQDNSSGWCEQDSDMSQRVLGKACGSVLGEAGKLAGRLLHLSQQERTVA